MAAPAFASAALAANGTVLTVTLSVTGTQPLLPATGVTGFTVKVDGVTVSQASAVRGSATTITITLSTSVKKNHAVTVAYTPGNVTDTDVLALAAFTAQSVTNSSTQVSTDQAAAEALATWIHDYFSSIAGLGLSSTAVYTTDGLNITRSNPPTVTNVYTTTTPGGYRVNGYDSSDDLVYSNYFVIDN